MTAVEEDLEVRDLMEQVGFNRAGFKPNLLPAAMGPSVSR